jgi:hypothetical protein
MDRVRGARRRRRQGETGLPDTPPLAHGQKEEQPLPRSNDSHASQSGSAEYCAKWAKPQMALCGARSLKRKGENCGAWNLRRADGVQKLSSKTSGCAARKLYQPSSVIAMVPVTTASRPRRALRRGTPPSHATIVVDRRSSTHGTLAAHLPSSTTRQGGAGRSR